MTRPTLRFGQPAEREKLEDLQRRASLVYPAYRQALLANPDMIELPRWQLEERHVRVAEAAGQTLGFAVVLPCDGEVAILDGLFVEPGQWKRGIGRALMEDAFALAQQRAQAMEVVANPYAEDFYVRLGFVRSGTVITPLGMASKMRRPLRQLDRPEAGT